MRHGYALAVVVVLLFGAVGCARRAPVATAPAVPSGDGSNLRRASVAREALAVDAAGGPVPTAVSVRILRSGDITSAPVVEATYPLAGLCGRAQPTGLSSPVLNPTTVGWVDLTTTAANSWCEAPLPVVPNGTGYRVLLVHVAQPCGTLPSCANVPIADSLSFEAFTVQTGTPLCDGKVILDLGDWTRTIAYVPEPAPQGMALVHFSLLRSSQQVTALRLQARSPAAGWATSSEVTGSDLRRMAGAYFDLPRAVGVYELRVVAVNVDGCEAGTDRPMAVSVTP